MLMPATKPSEQHYTARLAAALCRPPNASLQAHPTASVPIVVQNRCECRQHTTYRSMPQSTRTSVEMQVGHHPRAGVLFPPKQPRLVQCPLIDAQGPASSSLVAGSVQKAELCGADGRRPRAAVLCPRAPQADDEDCFSSRETIDVQVAH